MIVKQIITRSSVLKFKFFFYRMQNVKKITTETGSVYKKICIEGRR